MKRIGILNSFSYEADELKNALKHISEIEGYEIETIEDFQLQETISGAIWGLINLCDVLIAFVNHKNDSLYYQIGLAHGARKPVVIVTDHEYSLPPEIRGQRILSTSQRSLFNNNFMFQLKEAIEDATRKKSGYLGPRSEQKQYSVSLDFSSSRNFRDLFAAEGSRRGRLFERWFAEIAAGIEGWEVIESDSRRDRGFDLVIWNSQEDSELSILGNPIAVEIKAIGSMNSSMLHQFLHMSKKSGIKGLILATTGLNDKRTKNLLNRFRVEEGINAIALDRDDLINVRNPSDLLFLVKSKVRELLYGQEF
ncbi:restriction endonuclease [Pseudoalteromonas sp. SR41-4]|uniref:restriction endonuclease n=1 Tax=Pseudoalteromonas sp. SR41-4 TaxID=2760950 RepID=UPI0016039016|nr:restriction endonuclease [Pseudoalteromonas sp. SR41-4]MBB1293397.1 restriction endonuclease [Pseudoalteromonas sp. SR41-4]